MPKAAGGGGIVAAGKTENVTGVMTAMENRDLAFKTLLAIRAGS